MKVSLNTIKQLVGFELPPVDELIGRISTQLGGVEKVTDLGDVYKDAVIVQIMSAEQHPDADRLRVCKIDDGGKNQDVPRDENGFIQVVCGAPNAREGIFAVWLPPSATVPSTYSDAEPFVLSARPLRGVLSQGMLAAGDELAINGDHDGIIEIADDEVTVSGESIVAGASFARLFGLDDTIIDIENKMFTHRPDLFGQLGVAREIAGIFGHDFVDPAWYYELAERGVVDEALPLTVFNEAGVNAPRFMAVTMKDVTVGSSPLWLAATLVRWGGKSINNVVDLTNYIMLLTAQPTHAYDYDKIRGATLGVRMAYDGETTTLLNGKTYQLAVSDIVIADSEGVVGLAGIMGGGESEVDASTTNIILEVATFDMYAVRKSAMRHGVFTDALTRFNKGQSMLMNPYVLQELIAQMQLITGAIVAGPLQDDFMQGDQWRTQPAVTPMLGAKVISVDFINQRLGVALDVDEVARILTHVGFECESRDSELSYWAPAWRMDIQDPEDVVEEVGRLYGYDKLPRELPKRTMAAPAKNLARETKQRVREILSSAGASEVLTYSFVHENVMTKAGQDATHGYRLSNALSPDLQYYRTALMPSLLDKVSMNIRSGHDQFALFEMNKVHFKGEMDRNEPSVPSEDAHIALILASTDKLKPTGAAFYQVKRYLELIVDPSMQQIALSDLDLSTDAPGSQLVAPYHPGRSIALVKEGQIRGVAGEFKQVVSRAFKLPAYTAGFEIDQSIVKGQASTYRPLSRFPSITQDVSLEVAGTTEYQSVIDSAQAAIAEADAALRLVLEPVSIYQAEGAEVKTVTLRLTATHYERTLKEQEVTDIIERIQVGNREKTAL